jgi:hypothetical protein
MTLNLDLSPEREAALRAQAAARGLSVEQWLVQLAEQSEALAPEAAGDERPIWEILAQSMKDAPREDLARLPEDGASQIDHYLYGHPKR